MNWCLWDCVLILPGKLSEEDSLMADCDFFFFKIAEYSCLKHAGEHFREGIFRPKCSPLLPLFSGLVLLFAFIV